MHGRDSEGRNEYLCGEKNHAFSIFRLITNFGDMEKNQGRDEKVWKNFAGVQNKNGGIL